MRAMEDIDSAAVLAGWRVLRCVPEEVCMAETVEMLRRAMI